MNNLVFHAVKRRLGVFVSPVQEELAQSVCSCFIVNNWSQVVQPHWMDYKSTEPPRGCSGQRRPINPDRKQARRTLGKIHVPCLGEPRLNGTVCLLAPPGNNRRTEAQKLGSKAGIFMQWTAARSFSKRLSACVTLSAVGSVSQQMRRDDGCRQDVGGVVLRCRRRYSVQQS